MKGRTVSATEFRANVHAMLDEVARTGQSITVTRRGKPVATLHPPGRRSSKRKAESDGSLVGKYTLPEGLENMDTTEFWDCLQTEGEGL